jgi:hypothetical protein
MTLHALFRAALWLPMAAAILPAPARAEDTIKVPVQLDYSAGASSPGWKFRYLRDNDLNYTGNVKDGSVQVFEGDLRGQQPDKPALVDFPDSKKTLANSFQALTAGKTYTLVFSTRNSNINLKFVLEDPNGNGRIFKAIPNPKKSADGYETYYPLLVNHLGYQSGNPAMKPIEKRTWILGAVSLDLWNDRSIMNENTIIMIKKDKYDLK